MTDERDDQPSQSRFVIPALRVFCVRRFKPGTEPTATNIETLTIVAHVIQHNDNGRVLIFLDYIIDPSTMMPAIRLRRMLGSYIDLEEVVVVRESSLLVH